MNPNRMTPNRTPKRSSQTSSPFANPEISSERDSIRTGRGRIQPPPNYSSRAVQLKLFLLVGSLMLVVWLMFEARKPENWAFMGFDRSESTGGTGQDGATGPVDTRYFPQLDDVQEDADDRQDEHPSEAWKIGELDEGTSPSTESELFARTRRDFWRSVDDRLTPSQRQLLFWGMQQGRLRSRLDDAAAAGEWASLVETFTRERVAYEQQILRAVTVLAPDEAKKREIWTGVLQRMQKAWEAILPALAQVPTGTSDAEADSLQELQVILDELALARVEDNALRSRLEEREAWYRQFERLRAFDLQAKLGESQAERVYQPVSFLQLFKQPDFYRGRPIQIRGKVYLVQHQPAQENPYGVTDYHVLWIRPEGSADSPFQVYALRLPEGFPMDSESQSARFDATTAEEVAIDGVFFKRVAYEGQDGFRLAPLILTTEPTWEPRPPREAIGDSMPGWPILLAVCGGVAVVAVGIARYAMRAAGKQQAPGFQLPSREPEPDAGQLAQLMSEHDRGADVDVDEEERS